MQSIQEIINIIINGLDLSEDQKKALTGFYFIGLYKASLEILIGLKGNTEEFHKAINYFFQKTLLTLTLEEQKIYDTLLEQQKSRILSDILSEFSKNLPNDHKKKINDNLVKLKAKR